MAEYKQPETRIKHVTDHDAEKFYAQYKQVIIPNIWWEWQNTRPCLLDQPYVRTLKEAKERIDNFLLKSKHQWACGVERTARKKIKPVVEYIKYP